MPRKGEFEVKSPSYGDNYFLLFFFGLWAVLIHPISMNWAFLI